MKSVKRMIVIPALTLACATGLVLGQSQTNTNVYVEPGDGTQKTQPQTTPAPAPASTPAVDNPTPAESAKRDSLEAKASPDTVGGLAASEEKELQRRKQAKQFTTAGFGPAGFAGEDDAFPSYDIYVGRIWEVNSRAAIKALGEVVSDFDNSTMTSLNLGANFYALPTDVSPYLGGGFGFAYGREEGDDGFGFDVGASLGAMLFRTASAQLNVEGNAKMMFIELNDDMPAVYSARLGVQF